MRHRHYTVRPTCTTPSHCSRQHRDLHSFPTRRSSDLVSGLGATSGSQKLKAVIYADNGSGHPGTRLGVSNEVTGAVVGVDDRSEEHTSELQSHSDLVCRLLLEKKKINAASSR